MELFVDREKVEICLFNLISNALKFTGEHGSIAVSLIKKDDGIDIMVTDTGCGIPAEVGNSLFNSFYREYSNSGDAAEGLGIGLFLVKKFANAHKGSISYTSTLGAGTSFTLHLLAGRNHFGSHFVFEDIGEHSVFLDELLPETTIDDEIALLPVAQKELSQISEIVSDRPVKC